MHKRRILFFALSTLERITFGYVADLGILALLQPAMQIHSLRAGWMLPCCSLAGAVLY